MVYYIKVLLCMTDILEIDVERIPEARSWTPIFIGAMKKEGDGRVFARP